jgi:predicted CopG family antitoxin
MERNEGAKMRHLTTISVSIELHDKLQEMCLKGERYEDIIWKLINENKHFRELLEKIRLEKESNKYV